MPNHMKFCGCRRCRSGMHTRSGSGGVRLVVRKARRIAKQRLKQGKEPPSVVGVPYTD